MTDGTASDRPTAELSAAGVSIWLDDLSRERLRTGNLAELMGSRDVVGVTTNPSIFAKALAQGDAYDEQLRELAGSGAGLDAAVETITTDDVREAADVLRPAYDATDGVDGRVSIEVDPRLAHDTEKTVETAERLWRTVDRPNVLIKIPATVEGLDAITRTLAQGISVNVTLIFSLERYRAVMDAFLAGVEAARDAGHDLSRLASVASFFVSRVDSAVDAALEEVGSDAALALRGRAAVANAQLAFEAYEEVFSSDRWTALAEAGAIPQRPLWASTGVKDPDYPDTLYVTGLVTSGVVNTMPEATLEAFADHGTVDGDTVTGAYDEARSVLQTIEQLDISLAEITQQLEDEGVAKFEDAWTDLLSTIDDGLSAAKDS
ncbi:transaldolase [Paraoerskovia sediminicola]|nr:transaldolase [Paraoerskovia sediminicola]